MYNPNSPNNKPPPKRKKDYTPEEFEAVVYEWIEYIHGRTVPVEVDKVVQKDGKPLIMNKPDYPHIWKFCLFAGIDNRTYNNYFGAPGYEPYFRVARILKEYCNSMILEFMFTGQVSDKSAAFYLVNNSTMVDKQEVVHVEGGSAKPAWLTGAPGLPNADQKALPHESLPYEDVKEEKE